MIRTLGTSQPSTGKEDQIMLWPSSLAPQRLTPRGQLAVICAGRPGLLAGSEQNLHLGRWRS